MYKPLSSVALALVLLGAVSDAEAVSVSLRSSVASPAPVGAMVRWTATASDAQNPIWYRFRVRESGAGFRTVKDYGPDNTLDWTATEQEGAYDIEVSART